MARRATTKPAAPKATAAKTPVEQSVVPAAEITNETMVECRSGVSGNLILGLSNTLFLS